MRVLAIGECMAELSPEGGADCFRLGFAGDTFNTAWYLARLGVAASYFTAIGTDPLSARMRAFMAEAGVGTDDLRVIEDGTIGLYLISLADGERSFAYWRGQSAARRLADDVAALTKAIAGADLIYVSGITLAILDPGGREALLDALRHARAAGRLVAFDPNLRPRLWTGPREMTATVMAAAACCDIALPSFEDEAAWFADADPEATAQRYATAGARTIAVKNGAGEVLWRQGDLQGTVAVARASDVVDTTAAGDSFNAGFLAGLSQGRDVPDAVARGCRLATAVVQGRGALVPVPLQA